LQPLGNRVVAHTSVAQVAYKNRIQFAKLARLAGGSIGGLNHQCLVKSCGSLCGKGKTTRQRVFFVIVVVVVFAAAEIECGNKMQQRVIKFQ